MICECYKFYIYECFVYLFRKLNVSGYAMKDSEENNNQTKNRHV
ncbi:MAG: hypothetical protein BWY08_01983 [Bacteroidetes bacterium ADurb.Bin174]|nr:MAG: hypothetical protein BWY08_01983 [Bacteroidetes bacterium ADurb.Bin174]